MNSTPNHKQPDTSGSALRFAGMIAPETLLTLVESTAPYLKNIPDSALQQTPDNTPLIDLAGHPLGFLKILRQAKHLHSTDKPTDAQYLDYFALCIACHHATVATFVPTDVDSKIRGSLWYWTQNPEHLEKMFRFSLQAMKWELKGFSTRCTELAGVGPVSGHNGEMLGVLAGALGAFITIGRQDLVDEAIEAIFKELEREAKEFNFVKHKKGLERDLVCIAGSLTHNIGDLDQGIGYWAEDPRFSPYRDKLQDFNHLHAQEFDGAYGWCLKLYKATMATEGHRHYPLREVKALRETPELLLPLSPFLDDWGATVARSKNLNDEQRSEVLSQLLQGCKKINGQIGYYRAISGMSEALGGRFQMIADKMSKSSKVLLKESLVLQHLKTSKESFEASMRKKVRAVLG